MTYYISTFRYKIAFLCWAGAVMTVANGFLNQIPLTELLGRYGVSVAVMALAGCLLWRPAFKYAGDSADKVWGMWGDVARSKPRADFEGIRFERFYKNTKYGLLRDPAGYRVGTTLASCTCRDFRERRVPCAHMYKLADLLGVYDEWDDGA
ncbi:MAG: SWIM zinc finger domain-containing protein [Clostridiales Family XIII bacterium]|jgi:hypothetical protein|nr:SWIM zinc finger domain-containing protein [Clostridiales Family XIII bacterium]